MTHLHSVYLPSNSTTEVAAQPLEEICFQTCVEAAEMECSPNPERRWVYPLNNKNYLLSDDGNFFEIDGGSRVRRGKTFKRFGSSITNVIFGDVRPNLGGLMLESFGHHKPGKYVYVEFLNGVVDDCRITNMRWSVPGTRLDSRALLSIYLPSIPNDFLYSQDQKFTELPLSAEVLSLLRNECQMADTVRWAVKFGVQTYFLSDQGHCISMREYRPKGKPRYLGTKTATRHPVKIRGVFYGYKVDCGKEYLLGPLLLDSFVGPRPSNSAIAKYRNGNHDDARVENLFWIERTDTLPLRPVAERPLTWEETSQMVFSVFENQYGSILSTLEQRWGDAAGRSVLITEILNAVVDVLDKTAELALGFAGTTRMRIKKVFDTFDIPFPCGINADVLIALQRVHGRFMQMPDAVKFCEAVDAPGLVKVEAGIEINPVQLLLDTAAALKSIDSKIKQEPLFLGKAAFRLSNLCSIELSMLKAWEASVPNSTV
jgi:hypothetical protein